MQGSLYAAAAGLLSVLLLALTSWLQRQQAAGQGAALQAARDTAASDAVVIPAQAAIAQAEAQAPTTREAVIDRLNKGTL